MALTNVLDASAAVRLILGDPAAAGLAQQIGEAALVLAPELMLTEVANTLWKLRRADQLHNLDPQQLLADARDLVDRVEPDRHLQTEALALACHLNHPVYDCLYLALARREAATLISADRRLRTLVAESVPMPPSPPPTFQPPRRNWPRSSTPLNASNRNARATGDLSHALPV